MVAEFQPALWISFIVLFTLGVVFAASWWMFFALARRWIEARPWYALSDWAKENRFRFSRATDRPKAHQAEVPIPPPLDLLQNHQARTLTAITRPDRQLLEFRWRPHADSTQEIPGHVLLQTITDAWPVTGLRPAEHVASLIDVFAPGGGAALGGSSERFTILGNDANAAHLLLTSSVRALLPPDVGCLLLGQTLVLDFSARPFDPIELDRMLAVATQVAEHVPKLAVGNGK